MGGVRATRTGSTKRADYNHDLPPVKANPVRDHPDLPRFWHCDAERTSSIRIYAHPISRESANLRDFSATLPRSGDHTT